MMGPEMKHFLDLAERGRRGGILSSGEAQAARLADALVSNVPGLDGQAVFGASMFLLDCHRRPTTARDLYEPLPDAHPVKSDKKRLVGRRHIARTVKEAIDKAHPGEELLHKAQVLTEALEQCREHLEWAWLNDISIDDITAGLAVLVKQLPEAATTQCSPLAPDVCRIVDRSIGQRQGKKCD